MGADAPARLVADVSQANMLMGAHDVVPSTALNPACLPSRAAPNAVYG